jgi:hypothetical protein
MQQPKEPFGTRLQLLARLTLNAGKHPGNQPARLAHLDDGGLDRDSGVSNPFGFGYGLPQPGMGLQPLYGIPERPNHRRNRSGLPNSP